MKKTTYVSLLIALLTCVTSCENDYDLIVIEHIKNVEIEISKWKNNTKGVYSLIHDDFGITSTNGIINHADEIARKHDIKFGFAIVTSQVNQEEWQAAKRLISNGHEPINHTHNHYCGHNVSWCPTQFWDADDFDIEIDKSHQLIFENTEKEPLFFAFPFDQYTPDMLKYLMDKKYLGARSGAFTQELSPDFLNDNTTPYFDLKFYAHAPGLPIENLSELAFLAAKKSQWAIREVHGVEDNSWGSIPEKDYTEHIMVLEELQKNRELWVAPPSQVIQYLETSKHTGFDVSQEGATLNMTFVYDGEENISSEITFLMKIPKEIDVKRIISDAGESIPYQISSDNKILFNLNPSKIRKLKIKFKRA